MSSQRKQIRNWVSQFDLEGFIIYLQDLGVDVNADTVFDREEISEHLEGFIETKKESVDIFFNVDE